MKRTNDLAFVVANMCMIKLSFIINNASEKLLAYPKVCIPPLVDQDIRNRKESNHDDEEDIMDIDGVKEVQNEGNVYFHYQCTYMLVSNFHTHINNINL